MDDPMGRREPDLLRVPLKAFIVADYATVDLWRARPEMLARDAFAVMHEAGFDVAPVADEPIWRYVTFKDPPSVGLTVEEVAQPINVADVVASTSSLADSVARLRKSPCLFVISGRTGVDALVARADLQRPAVAMVALSLVLAAEAAMSQLIRETYSGDKWQVGLSEKRLAKAREVMEERRRDNAELELLDCIMLDDRLTLVQKRSDLVARLGYQSKRECRTAFKQLSNARDVLAHAGNLLSTSEDPDDAIELFVAIRRLAEVAWNLVEEVPWYWTTRNEAARSSGS